MKKGDVIIIVIMIIAVIFGSSYVYLKGASDLNKTVIITQNHKVIHEIKINGQYEKVLVIKDGNRTNTVHIKDGEIWMESANCNNQICVYEKAISKVGQAIVCLPHKLIVEIEGNQSSDVDIISE